MLNGALAAPLAHLSLKGEVGALLGAPGEGRLCARISPHPKSLSYVLVCGDSVDWDFDLSLRERYPVAPSVDNYCACRVTRCAATLNGYIL